MSQLPATAPLEAKVQLRQDLEQALARYGPADPLQEVHDIVACLAQQARRRIEEAEKARQRERQKAELLRDADWFLELCVQRCPERLVGAPWSPKRRQVVEALRPKLRTNLMASLTGDESWMHVYQTVGEWVAAWQADQEPEPERRVSLTQLLTWASGAAAVVDAATKVPGMRETLSKGLTALRERIAQRAQPQAPPPPEG